MFSFKHLLLSLSAVCVISLSMARTSVNLSTEGELCKNNEIATKSDLTSLNNTLEDILKETRRSLDQIQKMGDRLNSMEEKLTLVEDKLKMWGKNSEISEKRPKESNLITKVPLKFHPGLKGKNLVLSPDLRTATRTTYTINYHYAGVISQRELFDDEMFTVRIDDTVTTRRDWSMVIGVIRYPDKKIYAYDWILWKKDTWSIYSLNSNTFGKSNTFKDSSSTNSNYPLELRHLPVGTTVGVMRNKNGDLHFYLNGVDKGAAFQNVPKDTYAFVDVINYVSKVSIVN